jgi:ATPase subunit of ABC transporter with duplicated ATPase domains
MVWTEEIVEKSTPKELVEMQLQEWAQTDSALAETYDKSRLEDCWDWIVEKARELLGGDSGAVWHGKIFRMARDYFVDRVFEKEEQEKEERAKKQKEEQEKEERAKKQRAERPKKRVARAKTKRKAAPRDADSPEALAMDAVSAPTEAPASSKPEAAPVPGIQLDLFAEAR